MYVAVLAQALTAALRARLPGYATATPDTIQPRFLETPGQIITTPTRSPSGSNAAPSHPSSARRSCHHHTRPVVGGCPIRYDITSPCAEPPARKCVLSMPS